MTDAEITHRLRDQLARQVLKQHGQQQPIYQPLAISSALAKALLQKAIRRGEPDLAQRAAATLLAIAPDSFWRRAAVIAAEDLGIADVEAVALVTAAARAGKRWRAMVGGELAVAQHVVSIMARSDKCRATDDLGVVTCHHPRFTRDRDELSRVSQQELLDIAASGASLPRRALALWYAVGTHRKPYGELRPRRGDPDTAFAWMIDAGYPRSMVQIARDGYRATGEVICAFVPFLERERGETPVLKADDDFPPGASCGLATWARDMFTPEGRRALATLLRLDCATSQWVHQHIPPAQRLGFLGGVLFRIEGSLCRQRLLWDTAIELRRMADVECNPPCADATEIMTLLRADLPLLNEVRAHGY